MRSIQSVLKSNNFKFSKQFGQNFITDETLLDSIVKDANITEEDIVVEVGPGAGTLTRAIAKSAKKVISFEIDKTLEPILKETLNEVSDNTQIIFKDIQKVNEEELRKIVGCQNYKVVANLPYYITTPIIMKFLESDFKPQSITVMVQKEVAERLKKDAKSSETGAISLAIALEGEVEMTRIVKRDMFFPAPNVDSAVINIVLNDKFKDINKLKVKKVIKAAFLMRRKTLLNNLINSFKVTKDEIIEIFNKLNINPMARGEELSVEDYIKLADLLGI